MTNKKFDLTGMTCSACALHVEKAVKATAGVTGVSVNLLSNSMSVDLEDSASELDIITAVDKAGYKAISRAEPGKKAENTAAADEKAEMKKRLKISIAFLIPLMYISMGHMVGLPIPAFMTGYEGALAFAFTQFLLSLPIVIVNKKYFTVGFKTLFHLSPNMDSLIAIGSAAAMGYGVFAIYKIGSAMAFMNHEMVHHYSMSLYFESAAMILTLVTVGKYMETAAKGKTSEAISKLINLAPKTALLLRDGQEILTPVEQVAVGDIAIVKPGAAVAVDGVVMEGLSWVDESALTGESIPAEKTVGSAVTAGTVNKNGYFTMRATKVGEDTALQQIVRLVEEAASSKAPIAKLADRVSGVFVPVVIAIAVISACVWMFLGEGIEFALSTGIAVLVISCPCALGLATPTAIMVGTGKGAEKGILIKSAQALELLKNVNTVVLDKTGTITEGAPRTTDIIAADGVEEKRLLAIAAAVEKRSQHPLAEAILKYAQQKNIELAEAEDFQLLEGMGVSAKIAGAICIGGNPKLMRQSGVEIGALEKSGQALAEMGKTPLYFAENGKLLGLIAVADTMKATSPQAISAFKKAGLEVYMLTGDNQKTAEAIAKTAGIDHVVAQVMPADKAQVVGDLQKQGKKVAMIGDGINDAPALTLADVGIAIGAGTDIAIESADIVLMRSDLRDAATAIELSHSVVRNIKQNLFWALIYNTLGIPLAAGLLYYSLNLRLDPMFAAAAMSLSSVCVVTNALRLKLFKSSFEKGAAIMEKKIVIKGMMCAHCVGHVTKALEGMGEVKVVLDEGCAYLKGENLNDEAIKAAIQGAGYEVTEIK